MSHSYIKLPKFKEIYDSRLTAISSITETISLNEDEFKDNETISFRYYDEDHNIVTCTANVNISDDSVSISPNLSENDTLRFVESDNEPLDKNVIWVKDDDEDSNIAEQLSSLRKLVKHLIDVVNRHEHAFSHSFNSGDIYNSAISDMQEGVIPELTDYDSYFENDSVSNNSGSTDDSIIATSLEVYINGTPLSAYTGETKSLKLYKNQKYILKPVFTPSAATEVNNYVSYVSTNTDVAKIVNHNVLKVYNSGETTINAFVKDSSGETRISRQYLVKFNLADEPDYCEYAEPNVKHILIKSVSTKKELLNNKDYLAQNELIWCEEEDSLYIKANNSLGYVSLIKLSGTSSVITGDTESSTTETTNTYAVDDAGILTMDGDDIYVDSNGILNITGTVDNNGILNLLNTESKTVKNEVDDNGILLANNNITVDDNGILTITNATINNEGIIEI